MSNDARLLSEQRLQAIRQQAMADACDSRMNGLFRRKAEEQCLLLGHLDVQAERIRQLEAERSRLRIKLAIMRETFLYHYEKVARLLHGALPHSTKSFEHCPAPFCVSARAVLAKASEPEVEAKQPPTPAPTPTPVQPRKRHHYDPNGWYF